MLKLNEEEKKEIISKTTRLLSLAGRSNYTKINYICAINKFFRDCNYTGNLKDFAEEDFLNYVTKEFLEKNSSSNTYNLHIAAIKKMFLANYKKTFINDLIPRAKTKKRIPYYLPKEKFLKLINLETSIKHKCWFMLSFCCGLRACEVAIIKIEDINSKEHKLKILGKGNKERETIINDSVIKLLRQYYKESGMTKKSGYLFEGTGGKEHISIRTVTTTFCNLKRKYNLDNKYTHHSLRHSFAVYFLRKYNDLKALQTFLGHENIATTSIYVNLAFDFEQFKGDFYV